MRRVANRASFKVAPGMRFFWSPIVASDWQFWFLFELSFWLYEVLLDSGEIMVIAKKSVIFEWNPLSVIAGGGWPCFSEAMADSGFPTLDLMIEPGSGNYLLDHHAMAISEGVASLNEAPALYQIALRQNPQGEVDMPQAYGSSLPWSDASRAPDLTSTLHTQPDGKLDCSGLGLRRFQKHIC